MVESFIRRVHRFLLKEVKGILVQLGTRRETLMDLSQTHLVVEDSFYTLQIPLRREEKTVDNDRRALENETRICSSVERFNDHSSKN